MKEKPFAVIRSKLYLPLGRRELVARPNLFQCLDEGLQCKLMLISSPAGFGKTTLLAEWIRERKVSAGWVSLDEGDNDLYRFLTYVVYALQFAVPVGVDLQADLFQPMQSQAYEPLLATMINRLDEELDHSAGQKYLLVLDDYHLIDLSAIHDAVGYLLAHLPAGLHLAIVSREDPPLPLALLRARGELFELRAEDLRFSNQEAADFLNRVMGLSLRVELVQALAERTEGWIAGLQMAAISMQNREDRSAFIHSFTGSNRFILDYLLEEVLQRQPEAIQTFLMRTSVLGRFCGLLCDHVLSDLKAEPRQHAQWILEFLEKSNLFVIPLDDQREWYRYHRLFADLLRKRLNFLSPESVPGLYRRASEWFESKGDLEEAIEYAFLAGEIIRASGLIEQAAEMIMLHSQFSTLRHWLERLPDDQVTARPKLCTFYAWILFLDNQPIQEVEKWLVMVPFEDELAFAIVLPLKACIAAHSGFMLQANAYARQALEKLPEEDHFLRSMAYYILGVSEFFGGNQEVGYLAFEQAGQIGLQAGNILAKVMVLCNLAEIHYKQGQLRKAESLYQEAISICTDPKGSKLPIAGKPLIGLGDLMLEWNRLPAAEEYLETGIMLIEKGGPLAAYTGYLALARLRYAQGNLPATMETLTKAEQLVDQTKTTLIDDRVVAMTRAQLWVDLGDFSRAEEWVSQRSLLQEVDETCLSEAELFAYAHIRKYEWLVLAKLRLHQGRADEALRLLDQIQPEVEKMERVGLLVKIRILKALVFHQKRQEEAALQWLEMALELAEPEGYIRTFLEAGEPICRLLEIASRKGISPEYVAGLLAAARQEKLSKGVWGPERSPKTVFSSELVEALSEREMEVLHLIRSRLTVPEIADALYVAGSTVRSHIKSIYGKLGVHRRVDAVQRAQELGLFEPDTHDRTRKPAESH